MSRNEITIEEIKRKLKYCPEEGIFTWHRTGKSAGWDREDGYKFIRVRHKLYRAHRLAWMLIYGDFPKDEIDHIDGNPNNNQIKNLRLSNSTQNKCNTKIRKDNTTGIKGVYWYKAYQKWTVRVACNHRTHHLGYFKDFFEACCAASSERNKLHKEFARHG